jgi:hypothetical protein
MVGVPGIDPEELKEGFKVIQCGRVDCINFNMVLWQIAMSKVISVRTDEILLTSLVTASF